jgi:hypothetical protein
LSRFARGRCWRWRTSSASSSFPGPDLIKEDVLLDSQPPKYLYTKLADLKMALLAEAAADATTRAQQIAGNSGSKLGKSWKQEWA